MDNETLQVLRNIGFNRISLGVQDVELKVQEAVNRVQPVEEVAAVLTEARRLGFRSINMDLIYGLPHQTLESFKKTLSTIIELSPDRLSVFNYAHMPDRFRSQKHIHAEDLPSPETKLAILETTIAILTDAGYVYIGMDHFAKPDDELAIAQRNNQLHRNFQGYTTHKECDLVAMGVSSISQIGDVYYQNQHDMRLYTDAVESDVHAINRGVTLSRDDRIRRAVITQLICHFELDKDRIEADFDIVFDDYFADELEEIGQFAQDGLVSVEKQGRELLVTGTGRLLIRRICMTFDAYIPKRTATQGFSRII
ncbi:oxygen-independent coproporphyrinogen III oxidase [Aliamphritea spongicola]|nr:oxygen-independent coproporphyrinogen III oxidase [Aliamphritea spongicola]